jgi:hypothetical protein
MHGGDKAFFLRKFADFDQGGQMFVLKFGQNVAQPIFCYIWNITFSVKKEYIHIAE